MNPAQSSVILCPLCFNTLKMYLHICFPLSCWYILAGSRTSPGISHFHFLLECEGKEYLCYWSVLTFNPSYRYSGNRMVALGLEENKHCLSCLPQFSTWGYLVSWVLGGKVSSVSKAVSAWIGDSRLTVSPGSNEMAPLQVWEFFPD